MARENYRLRLTVGSARVATSADPTFTRDIQILKADGSGTFDQKRNVPVGSQWPGNIAKPRTEIARPAVIGIQRKQRSWREHWEHEGREGLNDGRGGAPHVGKTAASRRPSRHGSRAPAAGGASFCHGFSRFPVVARRASCVDIGI